MGILKRKKKRRQHTIIVMEPPAGATVYCPDCKGKVFELLLCVEHENVVTKPCGHVLTIDQLNDMVQSS